MDSAEREAADKRGDDCTSQNTRKPHLLHSITSRFSALRERDAHNCSVVRRRGAAHWHSSGRSPFVFCLYSQCTPQPQGKNCCLASSSLQVFLSVPGPGAAFPGTVRKPSCSCTLLPLIAPFGRLGVISVLWKRPGQSSGEGALLS